MTLARRLSTLTFAVLVSLLALLQDIQAKELPDAVHEKIVRLAKDGDAQLDKGQFREALANYIEALTLLPEPKTDWEACTWLLTSIGDANFQSKNYAQAKAALSDAMLCPDAIENPYIHLRLGESQFELGDLPRANDELARAYMGAGKEIFANEDPKYFEHLKTVLKPPAGGNW